MGMPKRTSSVTLLAAIAIAGIAAVPAQDAKAATFEAVSTSTELFLGRINNWMIWEFEGNQGRFCYINSSPEGTSPLRHRSPVLWVTRRPIETDDGGKEHVFEISLTSAQAGSRTIQIKVDKEKRPMAMIGDRFWLEAEPDEVDELLEVMLRLEAAHDKEKKRDPRVEQKIPVIEVHGTGGKTPITLRFPLLGLAKAIAAIDDRCAPSKGRI
jgi:hypothetical protein